MRPKLIYFAERHPRLSPAEFGDRRRRHGELGISLPRWRNVFRYAQCRRIALDAGDRRQRACDGVATVMFRSEEAWRAHVADPDAVVTRADEALTFARSVRDVSVLTTETNLLPHAGGAVRLFVLLLGKATHGDRFAEAWAERAKMLAGMLTENDGRSGYSHNLARPDLAAFPLGVASVEEISSDDPGRVLALLASVVDDARSRGLLNDMEWVATRERVLWPPSETDTASTPGPQM